MSDSSQDRLAPHSLEAEEAVLGAILLNPDVLLELSFLDRESFYILRHTWIWEAMERISERNEMIDNLSLMDELRNQGRLDAVGGNAYISHLINNTPSALHAEVYGRIVERAAKRRRWLNAASMIANYATAPDIDTEEMELQIDQAIAAATDERAARNGATMVTVMENVVDDIEARKLGKKQRGITSGYTDLDNILHGFQKKKLYVLAGATGMGKSAFMQNVAINAAKEGKRVAIFSLEMTKEELGQRGVAIYGGVASEDLDAGAISDATWGRFIQASGKVARLPIYIDDSPTWTVVGLTREAKRLQRRYGVDLLILDYLQLMTAVGKFGTRQEQVAHMSRGLKQLAKNLDLPVLALAQINRAPSTRADKRPVLSDLRESGAIEQDADAVLFVYRDDMYNEESERPNQADIIVAKQRGGRTGAIALHYDKSLTRFNSLYYEHLDTTDPATYRRDIQD